MLFITSLGYEVIQCGPVLLSIGVKSELIPELSQQVSTHCLTLLQQYWYNAYGLLDQWISVVEVAIP